MTEMKPENLKLTEHAEKTAQKTSDATKQDGVISGEPNQKVHGKAFALAHKDDKHPSGIMPALHESFGIKGDLNDSDKGNTEGKAKKKPHGKVSLDPRPSYVEGLKAIGSDEEAQGRYSIDYIERKVRESKAKEETPEVRSFGPVQPVIGEMEPTIRQIGAGESEDAQILLAQNANFRDVPHNQWQSMTAAERRQAVIEAFQNAGNVGADAYKEKIEAVSWSIPQGIYNVEKALFDGIKGIGHFLLKKLF